MKTTLPSTLRSIASAASTVAACIFASSSVASALPGDVIRVGPTRALTSITDGVAAVDPGDVILVDAATYVEEVNVTEGIAIVVDGGTALVEGRLTITGIPAGQQVLISGLNVAAPPQEGPPFVCLPEPAAAVLSSRGAVHFQDCNITGARGFGFCPAPPVATEGSGGHALFTERAFDVVLHSCVLHGGLGGGATAGLFSPQGGTGGSGLQLTSHSQVTMSASSATGGFGGASTTGGTGGIGTFVGNSSSLFAYTSAISGGDGGVSIDLFDGSGGDGLVSTSLSLRAVLQATVLRGGAPGMSGFIPGVPGEMISGPLTPTFLDGSPCTLSAPTLINDGESFEIRADGAGAGSQGSLIVARRARFRFAPVFEFPLLVFWPAPDAVNRPPVPAAGPDNSITYSFSPNPPPVGEDALIVWTQVICTDAGGALRFSEARALVLLAAGV